MSDHHNRFCLDGRRALVTGGSQGIGAGIARGLAEAGADLVLVARSEERLTHTAHQLRETGRRIDTVPFDLFQTKEAGSLMERIVDEFGSLDILVNVAGTTRRAPAEQVALDDWVKVRCPLGRWGHPGDLAGAAVFLAPPAFDFITGQMIYVDEGWLARF